MTKIEWTDESWNPVVGCTKIAASAKRRQADYWMAVNGTSFRKQEVENDTR